MTPQYFPIFGFANQVILLIVINSFHYDTKKERRELLKPTPFPYLFFRDKISSRYCYMISEGDESLFLLSDEPARESNQKPLQFLPKSKP